MKRIALLLMLATLGCRRHHAPGPGAEPEPSPAAPPAAANAPPATGNAAAPNAPVGGLAGGGAAAATGGGTTVAAPASGDTRYAMPDGGTVNGDPRGPRPNEVKAVLDGALADVRACFDANHDLKNGEYPVAVHFFVEPPGYTGAVTVKAPVSKDVTDCAEGVYQKLRFGEFRGNKLELAPSFTYWKREVGKDGGAKK